MNNKLLANEELVSIIMPAYNCSDFIGATINSVLTQTYNNYEIIIVDDCSTDDTSRIVLEYSKKDDRVKYHKLKENSGAAFARNTAVELAKGKYIAFLDSDDLWKPNKLEKQIEFMSVNEYSFTCSSYSKIDEKGNEIDKFIKANKRYDYYQILTNNPGNSTVIYNSYELGKIYIPNIRKRNDYVMWLSVIKKSKYLYGLEESLSYHRVRKGSLSYKKIDLIKYHWKVYREIEDLSFFYSTYLIAYWSVKTILNYYRRNA